MTTTTEKKRGKRTLVSFKDIQIAYLMEGLEGVEKLIKTRKNPGPLLRRAAKELKNSGKKVDTLEQYILQKHGPGTRGRTVPNAGQERVYRAQRIHAGGAFLRLPLSSLGSLKGDCVTVRFEKDQIVVKKIGAQA